MTKIMKLLRSDLVLTLIGGAIMGTAALSVVEPANAGHSHIYGETRSITVEQSFVDN